MAALGKRNGLPRLLRPQPQVFTEAIVLPVWIRRSNHGCGSVGRKTCAAYFGRIHEFVERDKGFGGLGNPGQDTKHGGEQGLTNNLEGFHI